VKNYLEICADLDRDGFGYWLAGFIDGEGSFIVNKQDQGYRPLLRVKLRDDDAAVLYECQRRTQLGSVFPEPVYRRTGRVGQRNRPQMVWQVTTKADLPVLVALLERYPLRAKKRTDFDIWKYAVAEWTTKRRYGHWEPLEVLRAELAANRTYTSWQPDPSPKTPDIAGATTSRHAANGSISPPSSSGSCPPTDATSRCRDGCGRASPATR